MIYLHTGQPGAGKTLYTLDTVRKRAEEENRPVFYHGIEILKPEMFPNWHHMEQPEKWFECPDGSIIVHDECQTLYRPRGNGAQVPEHVARFETHRHQGFDIYLITQHPMLIDTNIRRLAGEHRHVLRAFGAKYATTHTWQQVKEQCDKTRSDSLTGQYFYNKELFDAYKSATVHTHQARIPMRVWLLFILPVIIGVLGYFFFQWYDSTFTTPAKGAETHTPGSSPLAPGQLRPASPARSGPITAQALTESFIPRIPGLPHTAPRYDSITSPNTAPVPVGCVQSATRCQCYSQQGTRLDTPVALCASIVERGFFVDFEHTTRRDESSNNAHRFAFAEEGR